MFGSPGYWCPFRTQLQQNRAPFLSASESFAHHKSSKLTLCPPPEKGGLRPGQQSSTQGPMHPPPPPPPPGGLGLSRKSEKISFLLNLDPQRGKEDREADPGGGARSDSPNEVQLPKINSELNNATRCLYNTPQLVFNLQSASLKKQSVSEIDQS